MADVDHLVDLLDCPRWDQKLGAFEHKEFLVFAVLYDMNIWPSIFQLFSKFQEDAPEPWRHLADVFRVETLNKREVVVVHLHLFVVDDVVVKFSDGKQSARGL